MDALRWWLSMKYDAVMHSADRNVFEIDGSAVLCQSENEKISAAGQRIHTGQSAAANRLFAANFTAHYSELAAQDPVFADLQNIFDLSLVAALLADNRVADRIGWDLGSFAADGAYRTAHYQSPKSIMSVVNHRVYGGKDIVVQVAGGVDGQIRKVLHDPHVFRETATLAALQTKGRCAAQLAGGAVVVGRQVSLMQASGPRPHAGKLVNRRRIGLPRFPSGLRLRPLNRHGYRREIAGGTTRRPRNRDALGLCAACRICGRSGFTWPGGER